MLRTASIAPEFSKPASSGVERLLAELQSAWTALAEISNRILQVSKDLRRGRDPSVVLAQTRERYVNMTRLLLVEPTQQVARLRPIRRSLEAMQEFDREASPASVRARAPIDMRFQAVLSDAALDICEAWRIRRSGGTEEEWLAWEESISKRAKQAEDLLARYQKWRMVKNLKRFEKA